jgi:hypothetical protein
MTAAHPLPPLPHVSWTDEGRKGYPLTSLDEGAWTLPLAAMILDIPERDLKDLVRITGLKPCGSARVSPYRRSGRHPRVYSAKALIALYEAQGALREVLRDLEEPDPADPGHTATEPSA